MRGEGSRDVERMQLRRLEIASLAEATTLLLLVVVAVPLKHLAHWDVGVRVLGPVHGLAFLAYVWIVLQTISGPDWNGREALRLFVAAIIPFGGYLNLPFIARKAAELRRTGAIG